MQRRNGTPNPKRGERQVAAGAQAPRSRALGGVQGFIGMFARKPKLQGLPRMSKAHVNVHRDEEPKLPLKGSNKIVTCADFHDDKLDREIGCVHPR
jgi:hypothetical protein